MYAARLGSYLDISLWLFAALYVQSYRLERLQHGSAPAISLGHVIHAPHVRPQS
jgi:hypothetical protein